MTNDAALESQFTEELIALEHSGAGLPFIFTPSEAWYLLALLQLALRHPALAKASQDVIGQPGEFARGLAENIEGRLCKTPAMREVARRGWDSSL